MFCNLNIVNVLSLSILFKLKDPVDKLRNFTLVLQSFQLAFSQIENVV